MENTRIKLINWFVFFPYFLITLTNASWTDSSYFRVIFRPSKHATVLLQ